MSQSRNPVKPVKEEKLSWKARIISHRKGKLGGRFGGLFWVRSFLTIDEVGDWLNIGESTIRELMKDKLLAHNKFSKCLRFQYKDVISYIESTRVGGRLEPLKIQAKKG